LGVIEAIAKKSIAENIIKITRLTFPAWFSSIFGLIVRWMERIFATGINVRRGSRIESVAYMKGSGVCQFLCPEGPWRANRLHLLFEKADPKN
jgi:hypothetical protein